MKVLVIGAKGMLAQSIREAFLADINNKKNEIIIADICEDDENIVYFDITDRALVIDEMDYYSPNLVINCAAYTNVDGAEDNEELAYKINATGVKNLADACKIVGATLVHVSTDYVFGGGLDLEQEYSEDDEKRPETAYGHTKLAGEEAVVASGCNYYIFRTAWLYGDGPNFVRTMMKVGREHEEVEVVDDQFGSPTYAGDLAKIIWQAVYNNIPYGIYNATNLGFTNWADFTREIYKMANISSNVQGISSDEYVRKISGRKVAKRPANSKMSKDKLLNAGVLIPEWKDGLRRYLDIELNNQKEIKK